MELEYVSGVGLRRVLSNSGQAQLQLKDRILVERQQDDGGWKPTESGDRFVADVGSQFGLWKDTEVTEGHLWWKKVVRPLDGQINADEVLSVSEVIDRDHHVVAGVPSKSIRLQLNPLESYFTVVWGDYDWFTGG